MSSEVRVTPLLGGKEDGGVCSLLEIGGCRILLDCGCTLTTPNEEILEIAKRLEATGGVDCVLLSHADIHHIGALPIMFGSQGLAPVPVVCTLPVAKFAALVLYDLHLNIVMEGTPNNVDAEENVVDARRPTYTLDEVDECLSRVTSLKYSQVSPLPGASGTRKRRGGEAVDLTPEEEQAEVEAENAKKQVSFCAFNSGRTIGGAAWRIRHGATDVLYAMDVNLKKEIVLNGTALDSLPQAPELLIVEGSCASRAAATKRKGAASKAVKAEGASADAAATAATATATASSDSDLLSNVNETLRARGNVLIPCESCSRVLEVLQILSRHWVDGRRGLDHLIFLSPMSFNLVELARSQLEWMNDSICTKFYNGQANPFELPPVKVATTLREVERLYPGPKVVLSTDASVQCGMAKELLLRWGGNPLNKVLFLDTPDNNTLGAEVVGKMSSPSVVVRVAQPQRVELEGEELAAFVQEVEARRRAKEEEIQIKLRREELAALNVQSGALGGVGPTNDRTDREQDGDSGDNSDMDVVDGGNGDAADDKNTPRKKQKSQGAEGRGGQAARIAKFAQPLFPLFSTRERTWAEDEYGASVADLNLRVEEETATTRIAIMTGSASASATKTVTITPVGQDTAEEPEVEALPFKIMSSRTMVQFTCGFKVLTSLSGRADARAIKALVTKVQPSRVVVLRGKAADCDSMAQQIGSSMLATAIIATGSSGAAASASSFAPANNESVAFTVRTDRVNLLIPSLLLPAAIKELGMENSADGSGTSGSGSASCILSAISGVAQEQAIAANSSGTGSGLRKVRLVSSGTESAAEVAAAPAGGDEEEVEMTPDEFGFRTVDDGSGVAQNCLAPLPQNRENVTVSVGEVSFNALKTALQNAGIATESVTATSRDGSVGTVLVCQQQVMIRRAGENDFAVEGPPVAAYWAVRKVLYSHFAFLQS